MEIPEYITKEEVQRVCEQLKLSDWTKKESPQVDLQEAKIIQDLVGGEVQEIQLEEFKRGLEVELEHGIRFPDSNVTNNHPVVTGRIVLAHLKESLDYYTRLEVAEIEGDLLKALMTGNFEKLAEKYRMLVEARLRLSETENMRIKK